MVRIDHAPDNRSIAHLSHFNALDVIVLLATLDTCAVGWIGFHENDGATDDLFALRFVVIHIDCFRHHASLR